MKLASCFASLALLVSLANLATAQVLFSDPMESGSAFSTAALTSSFNTSLSDIQQANPDDQVIDFGFDYSAAPYFIPEAPNTQAGDTATTGLRLETNAGFYAYQNADGSLRNDGYPNAVSVFPTGMSFSGQFEFQFDAWMNVRGPLPGGGDGSTEFAGGFIGFDPDNDPDDNAATDPIALDGAGLLVSGEGGSSYDWRLYAGNERQNHGTHQIESVGAGDFNGDRVVDMADYTYWRNRLGTTVETAGTGADVDESGVIDVGDYVVWKDTFGSYDYNDLYNWDLIHDNADTNTYLEEIFPGKDAPEGQVLDAPTQDGTAKDGTLAFRWVTFKFTVDTDAGTALVEVIDAETDIAAEIATFTYENTYVNQSTIAEKLITDFSGNVALTYMDPFSSYAADDASSALGNGFFSFGVFDNFLVTQTSSSLQATAVPEPSTLVTLGLSLVGLSFGRSVLRKK